MSRTSKLAMATAVAALAVPAAAQAHVTLQPNTQPAGAFTVLDVRVPTERDNASTAKVDVQFPDGFAAVSYQVVPGWRVRVITKKLATPIQTDDGPITEGVDRMVWTRTRKAGGIKPGQFQDFPISTQIPDKAGTKLTFKALQTYSNGEIVRWIGAPGSDTPAPQVTITAAKASGAAASMHKGMGAAATSAKGGPTQPAAATSNGGSDGLSIAALVAGGLGLLLGGGAFAASRRRTGHTERTSPATA
jgi:periplasmic copper chaperone A